MLRRTVLQLAVGGAAAAAGYGPVWAVDDAAEAAVEWLFDVPVQQWQWQSYIQSFVYAQDPRDGAEFVFCAQSRPVGPGDVEDAYFHRHRLTGSTVTYLDTMRAPRFGHTSTFHVRISAAGNPWIWTGVERYSTAGALVSTRVGRVRYRPGTASAVTFPNVGPGNTLAAISCPGWRVVVRRALSATEVYTELDERDVAAGLYRPVRQFTRQRVGGTYQGSCATAASVFVLNGPTNGSQQVRRYDWAPPVAQTVDVSDVVSPTGPNTSDEPEGMSAVRGRACFGKRYNSTARRVYSIFGLN